MSILRDMFTAIKGAGSEAGEAIVDANAVRILEQELREADNAIHKAKQNLTKLKGVEIRLKREINSLQTDIDDYEAKAVEALNENKEDIAIKVAERIAELAEDVPLLSQRSELLGSNPERPQETRDLIGRDAFSGAPKFGPRAIGEGNEVVPERRTGDLFRRTGQAAENLVDVGQQLDPLRLGRFSRRNRERPCRVASLFGPIAPHLIRDR